MSPVLSVERPDRQATATDDPEPAGSRHRADATPDHLSGLKIFEYAIRPSIPLERAVAICGRADVMA